MNCIVPKEIIHKITFITEKKPLPGTPEAKKRLKELIKYYEERKITVQYVELDFHIQTHIMIHEKAVFNQKVGLLPTHITR